MKTKRPRSRKARDKDELIDWSKAKRVRLPNLKPSTQSILLRLPIHTLERIKAAANARDVPYQSLIKVWLEEKLST
jgi:predicted DNA binding CopG/RHH family protein